MQNAKWLIVSLLGTVVVVLVAAVLLSGKGVVSVDPAELEAGARAATVSGQLVEGEVPKVVIVEFSDFQCPACRAAQSEVKRVLAENEGAGLVFRHFPLTSIHKNAFIAAVASEVAGKNNKFWEYHDLLFERQNEWEEESEIEGRLVSYAVELGLDGELFLQQFNAKVGEEEVQADLSLGRKVGVASTPTFFVNGEKVGMVELADKVAEKLAE